MVFGIIMDSLEFCRIGKGRIEEDVLYAIFERLKNEPYFKPHALTADFAKQVCDNNIGDEYWVLSIGKERIGYGFIRGWSENWNEKCLGIVILPEWRHKRYGELFCRFLEIVAKERGLGRLRLHVNLKNDAAFNLYKKLGYLPVGIRENGEQIMVKQL